MNKIRIGIQIFVIACSVVLGICISSLYVRADEPENALSDGFDRANQKLAETRDRRAAGNGFGLLNYSPIDLIVPSKYGATLGWIQDASTTWEVEYLRGTLGVPFLVADIGSFKDERFSVIRRSYFGGNSFNLSYGLTYFSYSLNLNPALVSRIPGGSSTPANLLHTDAIGFNIAIGNRWTFDHGITLGVDWVGWAQPCYITGKNDEFLKQATNTGDRNDVDTALAIMSYFPRFHFFKVQVGILF